VRGRSFAAGSEPTARSALLVGPAFTDGVQWYEASELSGFMMALERVHDLHGHVGLAKTGLGQRVHEQASETLDVGGPTVTASTSMPRGVCRIWQSTTSGVLTIAERTASGWTSISS
jgi:hypothetical protein